MVIRLCENGCVHHNVYNIMAVLVCLFYRITFPESETSTQNFTCVEKSPIIPCLVSRCKVHLCREKLAVAMEVMCVSESESSKVC